MGKVEKLKYLDKVTDNLYNIIDIVYLIIDIRRCIEWNQQAQFF